MCIGKQVTGSKNMWFMNDYRGENVISDYIEHQFNNFFNEHRKFCLLFSKNIINKAKII